MSYAASRARGEFYGVGKNVSHACVSGVENPAFPPKPRTAPPGRRSSAHRDGRAEAKAAVKDNERCQIDDRLNVSESGCPGLAGSFVRSGIRPEGE